MLRLLYYHYKKSGKISTKKGGGLIIRHGRIIRMQLPSHDPSVVCLYLAFLC